MTSLLASLRAADPGKRRALLLFASAVVLLAELSRLFSIDGASMSILWPPTGLILGAALVYRWPVILVCAPLILAWLMVLQDHTLVAAVALTLSQVSGIAVALVYLDRTEPSGNRSGDQLKDRLRYLKAGGLSATVSASLGTLAYSLSASSDASFLVQDVFFVYWLLELVSIFLFAPLAYFILQNPRKFLVNVREDIARPGTATCLFLIFCLALSLLVLPPDSDETYVLALSFLAFPALCWLTLAAHPATVTVSLPLVSVLIVGFLSFGVGAVPQLTAMDQVVQVLLLLAGGALLLQIVAVVTFLRQRLTEKLRQQASTDFLSGLNNDRAFIDLIQRLMNDCDSSNSFKSRWLVYLEVLDFDNLEDLMGFRARRTLETLISARLMGTVGPERQPARLGSGIYALVFESSQGQVFPEFLDRLYRQFEGELFTVDEHQTRIRVSVGAVAIDGSLKDPNQYLSAATQAALMAREHLPRIHTIEDPESVALSRMGLTQRLELLKDALSEERLVLFAQLIVPLDPTGEGLTYEILLRLKGSDGNFVSPGVFLPVAEAYGFMKEIDLWVIRKTLRTLASNPTWLEQTEKCSINLAGTSLSSTDIVTAIDRAFRETGVPPEKIGFEVTETQRISSRDEAELVTSQLRDMGCSVSLDDFGTGLASFDYLKSFRFDTLKIDGAFIKRIQSSEHDREIVRATCAVARNMGLKTVAEFVENESIAKLLKTLGVDYGQGFGLGKPMPLSDLFNKADATSGTRENKLLGYSGDQ